MPNEWTADVLRAEYSQVREHAFEAHMQAIGWERDTWDAAREGAGLGEEPKVEAVLKGLWKVDGKYLVEGECPVSGATKRSWSGFCSASPRSLATP
jgi:hypothetical protein